MTKSCKQDFNRSRIPFVVPSITYPAWSVKEVTGKREKIQLRKLEMAEKQEFRFINELLNFET